MMENLPRENPGDESEEEVGMGPYEQRPDGSQDGAAASPRDRRGQRAQSPLAGIRQLLRDGMPLVDPRIRREGAGGKPRVMPDHYNGQGSWEDYLIHFEMVAGINGWDEDTRCQYLAVSLRGTAQQVLGLLSVEQRRDYEAIREALNSRFGTARTTELFRAQLRSRSQKKEEDLPALAQDIRRLISRAYPDAGLEVQETLAKDQFMEALLDPEMRYKVYQGKPGTLNEAVTVAVEYEAFLKAEKQRTREKKHIRSVQGELGSRQQEELAADFVSQLNRIQGNDPKVAINSSNKGSKATIDKVNIAEELLKVQKQLEEWARKQDKLLEELCNSRQARPDRRRPGICWSCQEVGHYANVCPKKSSGNPSSQGNGKRATWGPTGQPNARGQAQ